MNTNPIDWSPLFSLPAFALGRQEKRQIMTAVCQELHAHHMLACRAYRLVVDKVFTDASFDAATLERIPFIPVRMFKEMELMSIDRGQIVKTMTSSGTTGQQVSKIFLDRETALLQTKVLNHIMGALIGKSRLPMLIIDSADVLENPHMFSARAAAIRGFQLFGRPIEFALDADMKLSFDRVQRFLKKYEGQRIFLFGFTFMIWKYWVQPMLKQGLRVSMNQGILLHGGGWKKMQDEAVEHRQFKEVLRELTGLHSIHNYYGMVEQTGSIFVECHEGYLHASSFSEILIRNDQDFSILPKGGTGLIQLISLLPRSYPGFAILTEDLGCIVGEDDCSCGLKGTYFQVLGRVPRAELRGCSDVHATF